MDEHRVVLHSITTLRPLDLIRREDGMEQPRYQEGKYLAQNKSSYVSLVRAAPFFQVLAPFKPFLLLLLLLLLLQDFLPFPRPRQM